MLSRVCAAEVYRASSVAAGCGVDAANRLQASVAAAKVRIGIRIFLVVLLSIVPPKCKQALHKTLQTSWEFPNKKSW
jgi:hypothetical protein